MKIVIVIPTYNEKDNIGATIDNLVKFFPKMSAKHEMNILVIDDNSPDGTAEIVKAKSQLNPQIKLLPNRAKAGLGAAYIKAFRYAMAKLNADAVFEYDADGSHQPQYIPGMINALDQGADVVVGSRYVPGGSMPDNWGFNRKLISYFGNFVARSVLWSWQYKDMTSGFRVSRTSFLKRIDLENLLSMQFAYKIHLYYALHQLGAKMVEFPIDFIDRSQGKSKFPRNNILDSLRVVFTLRWRQNEKLFKVLLVGGLGSVVQLIFYNLFRLRLNLALAQNLSIETAIVSNFIFNNIWTFKAKGWSLARFIKFNLSSFGSLIIQNIVLFGGISLLGQSIKTENILVAIGIIFGAIWNYLMYTRAVWKK